MIASFHYSPQAIPSYTTPEQSAYVQFAGLGARSTLGSMWNGTILQASVPLFVNLLRTSKPSGFMQTYITTYKIIKIGTHLSFLAGGKIVAPEQRDGR